MGINHTDTKEKISPQKQFYDAIILGGGTAGLYCAYLAKQQGLKVALVEQNKDLGAKLRMAGGGMGNMTNRGLIHNGITNEHFISHNPNHATKLINTLFRNFTCQDTLKLLQTFHIPFEERDYGQIFCLTPVSHFITALYNACDGVDFYMGQRPQAIYYTENEHRSYHIRLEQTTLESKKLVIATGSNAYPQIGANDSGLKLAKKWGHAIHEFEPALVPLTLNNPTLLGLEGISLPVRMDTIVEGKKYSDPCGIRPLLFTHKGLSGPACLVISCFWEKDASIVIDFLPENSILNAMNQPENSKKILKNLAAQFLPERLVQKLIPEDLKTRKVAELSKKDRLRTVNEIHQFTCTPNGTEGMKKAEAAKGGICLTEITTSLESKHHSQCYFCGEILDITGLLGGYNIHFALACAKKVASNLG